MTICRLRGLLFTFQKWPPRRLMSVVEGRSEVGFRDRQDRFGPGTEVELPLSRRDASIRKIV
jgi:hypothetical protein